MRHNLKPCLRAARSACRCPTATPSVGPRVKHRLRAIAAGTPPSPRSQHRAQSNHVGTAGTSPRGPEERLWRAAEKLLRAPDHGLLSHRLLSHRSRRSRAAYGLRCLLYTSDAADEEDSVDLG